MKRLSTTILATALVGAVSLTALVAPAAPHGPPDNAGRANLSLAGNFVCSERGALRMERGLQRISERLQLEEEQVPAFEDLMAAALEAQSGFLEQCNRIRAAQEQIEGRPDFIDLMNRNQALTGARLEAVSSIMPQLEVFFDNLTSEQKRKLHPRPPRAPRNQKFGMISDKI